MDEETRLALAKLEERIQFGNGHAIVSGVFFPELIKALVRGVKIDATWAREVIDGCLLGLEKSRQNVDEQDRRAFDDARRLLDELYVSLSSPP